MRSATERLQVLAREAASCTRCELYRNATQTVFGEGPADADVFVIGEQPGDQEDRAGAPFIGPAGRILDEALAEAGIARGRTYVTNAVKHFKWTARGKRRIHERPNRREIGACRVWLDEELEAVHPSVIVLLGATAGQALFGPQFRVGVAREQILDHDGVPVITTNHPSVVLRAKPGADRERAYATLVTDLMGVAKLLASVSR